MRYRLDGQHYIDNVLLEPGTEVGDDCQVTWRYLVDTPSKDEHGNAIVIKAGTAMPPSMQMTPVDEEAKRQFRDWFETDKPERDMTARIPLQGSGDSVKVQAPGVPRPGVSPQAQHRTIVEAANPHPNPPSTREPAKPIVPPMSHTSTK